MKPRVVGNKNPTEATLMSSYLNFPTDWLTGWLAGWLIMRLKSTKEREEDR